jgi:hypothetical protein
LAASRVEKEIGTNTVASGWKTTLVFPPIDRNSFDRGYIIYITDRIKLHGARDVLDPKFNIVCPIVKYKNVELCKPSLNCDRLVS